MELIVLIGGVLLLDVLAMRFGVDSRLLNRRDRPAELRHEAHMERLASRAGGGRTSLRVRLANGLRALAVRIEPAACRLSKPGRTTHRSRRTPHAISTSRMV